MVKLDKIGWLERRPAIRGDGMLVWMTPSGLDGVGLGKLPAPRAPDPFSRQTLRSIRVAWAAADLERAGQEWIAGREMALAPARWAVEVANERGGGSQRRLPDLVSWSARENWRQVAVVIVRSPCNPQRQRAALEGWQCSIVAGRYAQVRYVAGPAVAGHLRRLAMDIGLAAPRFIVSEGVIADELPVASSVIENVDDEAVATDTRQPPLRVP